MVRVTIEILFRLHSNSKTLFQSMNNKYWSMIRRAFYLNIYWGFSFLSLSVSLSLSLSQKKKRKIISNKIRFPFHLIAWSACGIKLKNWFDFRSFNENQNYFLGSFEDDSLHYPRYDFCKKSPNSVRPFG